MNHSPLPNSPRHSKRFAPRLTRCALSVAVLFAGAAQAEGTDLGIHLSGFGTIGVAHSSTTNADFQAVRDQPNGPGHTRSWDFDTDSKLGVQADAQISDQFSATVMLESRQRYDNSYRPELMTAFGKWQATPELALRVGRMQLPLFLISDSRTIGYSQTTVRPPVDMYDFFGLYHYDGADLTWKTNVGNVALQSQAYVGTTHAKEPNDAFFKFSQLVGANVSAAVGDLTVRASVINGDISLSAPQLDKVFSVVAQGFPAGSFGPGSPAIPGSPALANQYEVANKNGTYTSLGLNYDRSDWFVTSEVGVATPTGFNPHQTLGYLSGGMRFDAFTPYLTVSKIKPRIAGATTHNPIVDGIRTGASEVGQKTLSLGLRWDAMKNIDVKTQFDRVKTDPGSTGLLANVQTAFRPGSSYNVVSVAVDFVF